MDQGIKVYDNQLIWRTLSKPNLADKLSEISARVSTLIIDVDNELTTELGNALLSMREVPARLHIRVRMRYAYCGDETNDGTSLIQAARQAMELTLDGWPRVWVARVCRMDPEPPTFKHLELRNCVLSGSREEFDDVENEYAPTHVAQLIRSQLVDFRYYDARTSDVVREILIRAIEESTTLEEAYIHQLCRAPHKIPDTMQSLHFSFQDAASFVGMLPWTFPRLMGLKALTIRAVGASTQECEERMDRVMLAMRNMIRTQASAFPNKLESLDILPFTDLVVDFVRQILSRPENKLSLLTTTNSASGPPNQLNVEVLLRAKYNNLLTFQCSTRSLEALRFLRGNTRIRHMNTWPQWYGFGECRFDGSLSSEMFLAIQYLLALRHLPRLQDVPASRVPWEDFLYPSIAGILKSVGDVFRGLRLPPKKQG